MSSVNLSFDIHDKIKRFFPQIDYTIVQEYSVIKISKKTQYQIVFSLKLWMTIYGLNH